MAPSMLQINLLNVDTLMSSALDGRDFALELIAAFQDSTPRLVEAFERAVESQNWAEAALQAHSVKGSANVLGLTQLGSQCAELEQWARRQLMGVDLPRPVAVVLFAKSLRDANAVLDAFVRNEIGP